MLVSMLVNSFLRSENIESSVSRRYSPMRKIMARCCNIQCGREKKRGMRGMPRERRRDRVGERSQGDRAEACAVLCAIEQDRMRPQMCDVGHASYVRIEHACGGQHPARHAERARLATRRLVHELDELARRRPTARQLKEGALAIRGGRACHQGGAGLVDV